MNFMNKKIAALIILLGVGSQAFGYRYGVTNLTEDTLVIRMQERRAIGMADEYGLVKPDKQFIFDTGTAYCLESLSWAKMDPNERFKYNPSTDKSGTQKYNGKNLAEIYAMTPQCAGDSGECYEAFRKVAREHGFINMTIKMVDNEVFNETAAAATALVEGLDALGCKALEITKDVMGLTVAEKAAAGLGGKGSKDTADDAANDAADASQNAEEAQQKVADAKTEPEKQQATQELAKANAEKAAAVAAAKAAEKIATLAPLFTKLSRALVDDKTFSRDINKIPAAIKILDDNKTTFVEALGAETLDKVKAYFNQKNADGMKKALELINTSLTELKKIAATAPSTKTTIDTDAIVEYGGCCGMNTYADVAESKVADARIGSKLARKLMDKNFKYDIKQIPAANKFLEDNKAKFVEVFGADTFEKVKAHLKENKVAGIVAAIKLVKPKGKQKNTTKTSLDSDVSINTYVDAPAGTTAAAKAKNCDFGLGKIASASAALTGISLCKPRNFLIIPNMDKDGNIKKLKLMGSYTNKPEYFAFSGRGE